MAEFADVIQGLAICAKYEKSVLGADHDIIYGVTLNKELLPEDIVVLQRCGWFRSEEYDCWACYV